MSNSKRIVWALALAVLSASAAADVPHSSILSRYGMTPDELPKPPAIETKPVAEEKSLFQVQPEQPWATVRIGNGHLPEMTGNISIDNSLRQEYERCHKLRAEMIKRGDRYVVCDSAMPGMP